MPPALTCSCSPVWIHAGAAVASTRLTQAPAAARRHLVPAVDHRPDPRQRRRRARRGRRGGQHQVDGVHQLLHDAWPAPRCSCSCSPAGSSPAPPARRARPPRWPAPGRRRAPAAARRLAGAITFLQLIIGWDQAYTAARGRRGGQHHVDGTHQLGSISRVTF